MRHSTRLPKKTFAFDLHVLSTPPAFVLSQDQTLQFDILNRFPGSYKNKSSLYNLELQRCPVSYPKASTRGPVCCCCYSVVKDRLRLFNQPKAPREKPAESSESNRLNFFCQPVFALFSSSVSATRCVSSRLVRLIVRTAANYLIGLDRSRGKVTGKNNFLFLELKPICSVFVIHLLYRLISQG